MKYACIKTFWFFANPVKKIYYFIFRPQTLGVKCLVENNGKFLFIKINYSHHKWTTPGGGVKKGELPRDAAIRETKEETGIDIVNPTFLGLYRTNREYKNDTVQIFWTKSDKTNIKIDPIEIEKAEWFSRNEIPKNRSGSVDKVFKIYDEYKHGKS